jgi:hypothetical protein
MESIYDALRDSHKRQRALCRKVLRMKGSVPDKQQAFKVLWVELEAHAAAEERYLYVPILMKDAGLSISRHALSEHHEIEELCDEVKKSDPKSALWLKKLKALSEKVHHHLKEEETKFFQVSGRILSEPQKKRLADQYHANFEKMKKKFERD